MKRIGTIADIDKAFVQVALQPKERDVTRFLRLKDIKQPVSSSNLVTIDSQEYNLESYQALSC